MNLVLRGIIVYIFLLIIFRLAGKRTLSEANTFDLVLLLIISEVTQQALVGQDFSITAALILILTLVGADLAFAFFRRKSKLFDKITDSTPLIVVDHGKPLKERMKQTQVDEDDILEAARKVHGLERMDQIKYAVLEKDGQISIIPLDQN